MTAASPLGSYRPGRGPLHRLRPGAKLLGLFGFAIIVMWTSGVLVSAVWLGIAVALAILAGLRGRDLWRVGRRFALVAIPLFAFQAWQHGWERGFEVVGDLFALILAASAVTASTAVEDMIDTITWALGPLRGLGVKPDRVALSFSLVIRAIPSILGIASETREAARARGLERDPRALLVPFVVRTVAHAHATGEALAARGIGEE
ncbi:energy-coupling factor transporter transmembrane component T family protein [Leucobacter celer]|uniref:energy-coupling factor transporter transmembrane component T family protein n=1 Tax=Leucobacter celer TaxID=668625 RepID=UPI0006A7906A|nr:energy-coupling factor transporter transmembrane component T [Leucobacter celer]